MNRMRRRRLFVRLELDGRLGPVVWNVGRRSPAGEGRNTLEDGLAEAHWGRSGGKSGQNNGSVETSGVHATQPTPRINRVLIVLRPRDRVLPIYGIFNDTRSGRHTASNINNVSSYLSSLCRVCIG